MENEVIQKFIEESEIYLPVIRSGILLCSQEGKLHEELKTSIRTVHTVKGAAYMVGQNDIGNLAGRLEADLESAVAAGKPPSDEHLRQMLDKVAQIEALVTKLHFGADSFPTDFTDFLEESFGNLQIGGKKPAEPEKQMEIEEEFEIDDEMREVFALEAEDLLKNIGSNLEILEKSPNNREALLEIRRNAHTLKGSAGIIGLKNISKLAHRVEDLLDYLAENEIEGSKKIFELLQDSTDCLNSLANNDISEQLTKKISQVGKKFDEIMSSFNEELKTEVSPETKPTEKPETEAVSSEQSANSTAQPRSVIRVSLEKLDELVLLVSEMVISRSVFEQRLAELGQQIEELQNSTARLQRSTGKLEIDFEAETLVAANFYQPSVAASPNQTGSLNNFSEFDLLELDRYTEFHQTTRELAETSNDTSAINNELDNLRVSLETIFDHQRRLIEEMQDKLLRLRMVSFGSLTSRLNRTVRVTAEQENKLVELVIEGENLELDTQILDCLVEPLLHLLRNAVAHGIETPDARRLIGKPETGKITVKIYSEGMHIVLSVTDDGRGITASAIKAKAVRQGIIKAESAETMSESKAFELIFLPGITTAQEINYVSGRGVGMNIVKTSVERQKGTIAISSEAQKGTTFTIRLPMSLAVTRALLVKANGQTFAFPLKVIKKVLELPAEKALNARAVEIEGVTYPISHLNELMAMPVSFKGESVPFLLLETLEKPRAVAVEEIIKTEEIVIKPIGEIIKNPSTVGAAILGDGSVVPVLDLIYLLKKKETAFRRNDQMSGKAAVKPVLPPPPAPAAERQISVMIVDDSPSVRHINSKLIKNNGMEAIIAKDGLEALEILQAADHLPDVILTDVEMPRMDGYELLAAVRKTQNLNRLPVVMITSRTSDKHRLKALDLGVSEYLTKPYDESKLIEVIKNKSQVAA